MWFCLATSAGRVPRPGATALILAGCLWAMPAVGLAATAWSWHYIEVDNSRPSASFGIDAGDLSGDGYADIVSGSYFYRSPGGNLQGSWTRVGFPVQADAMATLDVDSDDRGDVIAVSCSGVFWIEANDRAGSSWTSRSVGTHSFCDHGIGAQGYCRAQIVAGDREEIVVVEGGDVHCVQVPTNPAAGNWPLTVVATGAASDGVAAGDIDGDGDVDVTIGSAWWENPGSVSGVWDRHDIAAFSADVDRVACADLDGDQDVDIVVTIESWSEQSPIYWMENTGGGRTWTQHTVGVSAMQLSMNAADMDNDGDVDVVAAEGIGRERVQVWENSGRGTFTAYTVDEGRQNHTGTILVDFDNDGDRDIASQSWTDGAYMYLWRSDLASTTGVPPVRHGAAAPAKPRRTVYIDLRGRLVWRCAGSGAFVPDVHWLARRTGEAPMEVIVP